jgi:hypothetical protein
MPIVDDVKTALTNALSAGANAARGQGVALKQDFETLVRPNLEAIAAEVAAIVEDLVAGNISADQARDDLATQSSRIEPLILGAAELALLAVQVIINAVLDALKAAVNAATSRAVGIALL